MQTVAATWFRKMLLNCVETVLALSEGNQETNLGFEFLIVSIKN